MAFFNDLGKKIGNAATAAAEKAKDLAGDAAEMAKDTVEITKLRSAIAGEEKDIQQSYLAIGKAIFELEKANPDSPVADLCAKINTALQNIEDLKAKIVEIKTDNDDEPAAEAPAADVVIDVEASPVPAPEAPAAADKVMCPDCGAANDYQFKFCQQCGKAL